MRGKKPRILAKGIGNPFYVISPIKTSHSTETYGVLDLFCINLLSVNTMHFSTAETFTFTALISVENSSKPPKRQPVFFVSYSLKCLVGIKHI